MTPNGTPQHSIVIGVNGAGKSALLMDLMSQTDCDWAYRFYQEEGMAFVTQAQLCGMRSLVLRESGDSTLNPFDTLGLPLTSSTVARVVRRHHGRIWSDSVVGDGATFWFTLR